MLNRHLPLLVGCRTLVSALVFLEKLVCFVRSEVIVSEDTRFKPASGKETENAFEIIEECIFVANLDGVAEEIFACWLPGCMLVMLGLLNV